MVKTSFRNLNKKINKNTQINIKLLSYYIGFLSILLGFCSHWGIRRATFSKNKEISPPFRTEFGRL